MIRKHNERSLIRREIQCSRNRSGIRVLQAGFDLDPLARHFPSFLPGKDDLNLALWRRSESHRIHRFEET